MVAARPLGLRRVGLGGPILDRRETVRPRAGVDLDTVVGSLAALGRELIDAMPPSAICVGVGASYCGMVRPGDGMVLYGPELGWVDRLGQLLGGVSILTALLFVVVRRI